MSIQNIGLFQALNAKMNYLDQRQQVLSQNIANANTPDYKPKDLTKVDFGVVLKEVTKDNVVRPQTTSPLHMPNAGSIDDADSRKMKKTYDVTPTGNAVVMEEQMVNASKTNIDFNLMTSLYQKNVSMMRIALGVNR
jgi:flagellar basal-body rod protein FlgB